MKNYNKILEAINRGIQLALDDFDDEETPIQNIKSKQVYRDYTKEYLDLLKNEVVDLGLPSGTLWCKYNLDVDPKQLTNAEDWYGKYYAWGELEGNKPEYNLDNYKFNKLSKYCNGKQALNGFTDNLNELLPEDDVVYQKKKFYNFKFHIPTKEQLEELLKYTKNYQVNNYDPNKTIHNPDNDDGGIKGLNGRIFEGNNGKQLFIPAAGRHNGSDIHDIGFAGYLWSSSLNLDNPNNAWSLELYSTIFADNITMKNFSRCVGCSIHPVIKL